jgi:hypothetical protein
MMQALAERPNGRQDNPRVARRRVRWVKTLGFRRRRRWLKPFTVEVFVHQTIGGAQ